MIIPLYLLTSFVVFSSVSCYRIKRQDGNKNTSCTTPYYKPGTCVSIKECPSLMNIIVNHKNNPEAVELVYKSICYFKQGKPLVCCNNGTSKLFPDKDVCGLSSVQHERVVGGRPAALGSWPWIAILGYKTATNKSIAWLCGGTLISDRYIVTAAHCVVNTGTKILSVVRLGELDINKSDDGASPIDILVEQVVPHEHFNWYRLTTDIALVKLADKVVFTNKIRPICLPFGDELRYNLFAGYTPFLAGWGSSSETGPTNSALQEVQLDVTDIYSCMYFYLNVSGATIDEKVICAGRTGKDACRGDSGGPLMLPRGKNFYLIGIVSYGFKCAEPGYPGIYTRVTEFVDWIDSNVVDLKL